jgi:hypothetical protein
MATLLDTRLTTTQARARVHARTHTHTHCTAGSSTKTHYLWVLSVSVNETNMMQFSFNLLRIKGHYVFRTLFAHPQEGIHKRHLVYCVSIIQQPSHSKLTLYARNIPHADCGAPPEDEQVMLETCRGPWFSIKWNVHHVGFTILIYCDVRSAKQ